MEGLGIKNWDRFQERSSVPRDYATRFLTFCEPQLFNLSEGCLYPIPRRHSLWPPKIGLYPITAVCVFIVPCTPSLTVAIEHYFIYLVFLVLHILLIII